MCGDYVVGMIIFGDWGYWCGLNFVYVFVEVELVEESIVLELDLFGDWVSVEIIVLLFYDFGYDCMCGQW